MELDTPFNPCTSQMSFRGFMYPWTTGIRSSLTSCFPSSLILHPLFPKSTRQLVVVHHASGLLLKEGC